jgi:peptide deformylase
MANLADYGFVPPDSPCLKVPCFPLQPQECVTSETAEVITRLCAAIFQQRAGHPSWPLVGAAAPQIGINKPIIVIDFPSLEGGQIGYLNAFINPTVVPHSQEVSYEEEPCPSVDFRIRGVVARSTRVFFQAWNPDGSAFERVFDGRVARHLQHLCDHTQGILVPDRNQRNGHPCHIVFPEEELEYQLSSLTWGRIYDPGHSPFMSENPLSLENVNGDS